MKGFWLNALIVVFFCMSAISMLGAATPIGVVACAGTCDGSNAVSTGVVGVWTCAAGTCLEPVPDPSIYKCTSCIINTSVPPAAGFPPTCSCTLTKP